MSVKFLFYTPYAGAHGHALPFALKMCERFVRNGHFTPVVLAGTGFTGHAGGALPYEVVELEGVEPDRIEAARFHRFGPLAPLARGAIRLAMTHRVGQQLDSLLARRKDIRLVFFENYEYASLYRDWRRLRRERPDLRMVVASHLADFSGVSITVWSSWYKRAVRRYFRRVLSDADGIIFSGERVKQEIFRQLPLNGSAEPRSVVMQWPAEPRDGRVDRLSARARLGIPADAKVALVIGTLRVDKRVDVAIGAVARARAPVVLVIAGAPASVSADQIRAWTVANRMQDRTLLRLQHFTDSEEIDYYSAADVFLYPSDSRFSNHQSGVLSTCRTYRLPAIVSDAGEIGDYVKRYQVGMTCPPEDVAAFASAIDGYFATPALGDAMRSALDRVADQFSWEKAAERLEGCFTQALAPRETNPGAPWHG